MILLQPHQEIAKIFPGEALDRIEFLITREKRLGALIHSASESVIDGTLLKTVHDHILETGGQYISLNIKDFGEMSLSDTFLAALEDIRKKKTFRIHLPSILQNNPRVNTPFINRAILWEQLCDRLVEDEDRNRPTLAVLENLDAGDIRMQHDLARLIRFHEAHQIRRSFLIVWQKDALASLQPELGNLVDVTIEI